MATFYALDGRRMDSGRSTGNRVTRARIPISQKRHKTPASDQVDQVENAPPVDFAARVRCKRQRLATAQAAVDDLLTALSLATEVYHLTVRWCEDEDILTQASALTPHLIFWLTREIPARCLLVYGDALQQTIYLSRRVLRIVSARAARSVSLEAVSQRRCIRGNATSAGADNATSAGADNATSAGADNAASNAPAAQMVHYQAEALLAVAARLALDTPATCCYAVTAHVSVTDALGLADDAQVRMMGRVLTLPRGATTQRHRGISS